MRTGNGEGEGPPQLVAVTSRAQAKRLREEDEARRRRLEREHAARLRNERVAARESELAADDAEAGRVAWTLPEAAVVLAVMMAGLFASDALLSSEYVRAVPKDGQAVARATVLGVFYVIQLLTLGFLSARRGSSLRAAFGLVGGGLSPRRALTSVVLVLGGLVVTRAVSTLWGVATRSIGWDPPPAGDLQAVFGAGGAGLLLAVGTVVILGPFAEELAFRGVVLRAAAARWGQWPAILGTAVLFAAYHVTAWTLVPHVVLGVVLGWLAWRRRSLWSAICLHALSNGIVVGAAYWLAR